MQKFRFTVKEIGDVTEIYGSNAKDCGLSLARTLKGRCGWYDY